MKLLSLLLALLIITPLNYEINVVGNDVYKNACRYNVQGYIYVHIEGDAYQRGYQHGYLLYAEILDMMYRWSNIIHNCPVVIKYLPIDKNSSQYEKLSYSWWESCKKQAMRIFWPYYPEEYREEIKGIADGVKARGQKFYGRDVTYEDILTLNEMYELMSILTNPTKSIHIGRDIMHGIARFFPQLEGKEIYFDFSPSEHCNGFAAVGNATKDGNIVISDAVWCGGWWYTYYIAQRWNVILDIEPSSGHRIIIATSPGLIWSDEDYWQNDAGLAMIETTFIQGYYKLRGVPLAIRTRMAMQYANSIDEIIEYMLKENTGVMNSQWLIADAKEKEIALFEFGLYHYAVERTKNGFLWSANNPFNFKVRREILGYEFLKAPIFRLAHLLLNATGYQYYTFFYTPSDRDIKFEELGKKYYGRIDANVVKKIMSTPPISDFTTYIEITDGNMIWDNGLWGFYGNPNYVWNTSSLYKLKGVRDVPAAGWTKIYGVPYDFEPNYEKGNMNKGREAMPLWEYVFCSDANTSNYKYAKLATDGKNIYAGFDNNILALDANGSILWSKTLDGNVNEIEANGNIYVVTSNKTYCIDENGHTISTYKGGNAICIENGNVYIAGNGVYKNDEKILGIYASDIEYGKALYIASNKSVYCYNDKIKWQFNATLPVERISYYRGRIYASSYDGCLYCIDENGKLIWKYTAGWGIVTKAIERDGRVYFASLDGNVYCLDEEGHKIWTYSSNASIHGEIMAYGSYIFFGSDDGRFYAVNKSDGKAVWSFAPAHEMESIYNYITTPILSNAIAFNGRVAFSSNGKIYCMDAKTFEIETTKEKEGNTTIFVVPVIAILAIIAFAFYKKYKS